MGGHGSSSGRRRTATTGATGPGGARRRTARPGMGRDAAGQGAGQRALLSQPWSTWRQATRTGSGGMAGKITHIYPTVSVGYRTSAGAPPPGVRRLAHVDTAAGCVISRSLAQYLANRHADHSSVLDIASSCCYSASRRTLPDISSTPTGGRHVPALRHPLRRVATALAGGAVLGATALAAPPSAAPGCATGLGLACPRPPAALPAPRRHGRRHPHRPARLLRPTRSSTSTAATATTSATRRLRAAGRPGRDGHAVPLRGAADLQIVVLSPAYSRRARRPTTPAPTRRP